jgi:hypothetical protein
MRTSQIGNLLEEENGLERRTERLNCFFVSILGFLTGEGMFVLRDCPEEDEDPI